MKLKDFYIKMNDERCLKKENNNANDAKKESINKKEELNKKLKI